MRALTHALTRTPAPRRRGQATAAEMYDVVKILMMGGGYTPTNTAEVIDLNQSSPQWRYVAPTASARRQLNATILADGSVLANGGTRVTGFSEESRGVLTTDATGEPNATYFCGGLGSLTPTEFRRSESADVFS
ncbi:MAG: hypothetical protein ABIT38_21815 [Gemmatimonadaceae bacterium]